MHICRHKCCNYTSNIKMFIITHGKEKGKRMTDMFMGRKNMISSVYNVQSMKGMGGGLSDYT